MFFLFGEMGALCTLHRKKSFSIFQSPAWMSFTKVSLGGNYDVINKLFLPREILVSDIPAGDGNIEKLFYVVSYTHSYTPILTSSTFPSVHHLIQAQRQITIILVLALTAYLSFSLYSASLGLHKAKMKEYYFIYGKRTQQDSSVGKETPKKLE